MYKLLNANSTVSCAVFYRTFVARLFVFEDILDHVVWMLHVGPDTVLERFVGPGEALLPSFGQLLHILSTLGNMPSHHLLVGSQRLLHVLLLLHANLASIDPDILLLPM